MQQSAKNRSMKGHDPYFRINYHTQAIRCQFLAAEAQMLSKDSSYGICSGQNGTGTGSLRSSLVSLVSQNSSSDPYQYSSITVPDMCDRANYLAQYHNLIPCFGFQL
jgi:hypothetical protein